VVCEVEVSDGSTPFKETSPFSHESPPPVTTHDTSRSLCHSSSSDDHPGQRTNKSLLTPRRLHLAHGCRCRLLCLPALPRTSFSSRALPQQTTPRRRRRRRVAWHEAGCRRPPRMRGWPASPTTSATRTTPARSRGDGQLRHAGGECRRRRARARYPVRPPLALSVFLEISAFLGRFGSVVVGISGWGTSNCVEVDLGEEALIEFMGISCRCGIAKKFVQSVLVGSSGLVISGSCLLCPWGLLR
jgi:hypothetical protein